MFTMQSKCECFVIPLGRSHYYEILLIRFISTWQHSKIMKSLSSPSLVIIDVIVIVKDTCNRLVAEPLQVIVLCQRSEIEKFGHSLHQCAI